ncbi:MULTISPECIES: ABC transporter ATP-binding protein [Shouchella]|uniref:Oligopeptide transport ATP-binding protein n=3 Tax=Bacillaceae TaxID=186817 RepID=A0A060LUQ2_9BACI|nr:MULTISPECIES: ABC transporter ATP-binding protein [Bacillaceae]RQW20808.1 ABC transporter ATP-binding protein [Bacillus sp. C1-1]AIC94976.1 oligopeptide transport ATP-binding protein [Shouchella lehensis G1]KQL58104.1 peptide ABC transporter ATP-binding protein [Alkalicoccobacillus plakortidis]MBG9784181.1 peptide ABC transporter ATP-binding protein [Shouchella lehensis]TES50833.1 ABC transporter ATP-binding protein [Shouchella lehensis]
MGKPLLELKNVKTYFQVNKHRLVKAVDDVSFHIDQNEVVALVGESGSGKSMTSMSIMGLVDSPGKVTGAITLNGTDLNTLSAKKLDKFRGKDIAMIFQEPMTSLNPVFSVGNQIIETIRKHTNVSKNQAKKRAIELLKLVGFSRAEESLTEFPHQLSGGMRQRVMIAMAMSCNPKLLIADEPTTALDVTIQQQILDLMIKVKNEFQSSILLITHDLGVVAETADRVLVMYGGQIVEEAPAYELFTSPSHPYTQGLLKSMPNLEDDKERLEAIRGMVPPAHQFPSGCRFASRCDYATDVCNDVLPELVKTEGARKVRCLMYQEGSLTPNEQRLQEREVHS